MNFLSLISATLLLAYPFAVFAGLRFWGAAPLAFILLVLFFLRIACAHFAGKTKNKTPLQQMAILTGLVGITLVSLSYLFKQQAWFFYYPVAVNAVMLLLFSHSLWQPQSLIEQFARLQEPDLNAEGVHYTRTVTKVWCVFFIINAALSLLTCFLPLAYWTLYNGLISYLLAGSLFIIEFLIRKEVRAS